MALAFYALSGSPFAWRVWLALEHKSIVYDLRILSADAGDMRKPDFAALNPHGKVPVIVDDGFALYESSAILDYLDAAHPGRSLTPDDPKRRALAKRIAAEADAYLYPPIRALMLELLMRREGEPQRGVIDDAKATLTRELAIIEKALEGRFALGDEPSLADFTLYPLIALVNRMTDKRPGYETGALLSERMKTWARNVESLPYYASTVPPHWRA